MLQSTPKLEPSTANPPLQNIPQIQKINYGENLLNNQSYISSDRIEVKSVSDERHIINKSMNNPKINEEELIKSMRDNYTKYFPGATNEVIENINQIKDYKWKLGVILNDKINILNQKIKEERDRIEKKKKEINENKVYEKKINHLNKLIRKEEAQGHSQEQRTNLELKNKKEALTAQLNQIEQNKKNLRETMMKKFNTMLELKQKLNSSLNELLLIQPQIRSRKFLHEEEEFKKEPSLKIDPDEKSLLHLSKNIEEHINKNILIKNNEDTK